MRDQQRAAPPDPTLTAGAKRSVRRARRAAAAARWSLTTLAAALVVVWVLGQWWTAILRTPATDTGWFIAAGIGEGAFVVGWTSKPALARHKGVAELAPAGRDDHWIPRFVHTPAGVQIVAPVWLLVLLSGAPAGWLWFRHLRRARWARAGRCAGCGYPLPKDQPAAACPECGTRR